MHNIGALSYSTASLPWSFVAAGAVGDGNNTDAVLPAGVLQNDLLIIHAAIASGGGDFSTPAGWSVGLLNGGVVKHSVWYKIAGASEGNATVPNSGGSTRNRAYMLAYRNIKGTPLDVLGTEASGTSASPATASLTTSVANGLVVSFYVAQVDATGRTFSAPASTTTRKNVALTETKPGLLSVDENKVAAGATSVRTATLSSSDNWDAFSIAFKQV